MGFLIVETGHRFRQPFLSVEKYQEGPSKLYSTRFNNNLNYDQDHDNELSRFACDWSC